MAEQFRRDDVQDRESRRDPELDFAEVSKALQAHVSTLVHLRLHTFSGDDVVISSTPPMDSLRSFRKLKTLDIDDRLLYGGDVLGNIWHQDLDLGDVPTILAQLLPSGISALTLRTRKHAKLFFGTSLSALAGCDCSHLSDSSATRARCWRPGRPPRRSSA